MLYFEVLVSSTLAVSCNSSQHRKCEIAAGKEERPRVSLSPLTPSLPPHSLPPSFMHTVTYRLVEEVLVKEKARKTQAQQIRGTRHSSFGGTFVVKNQKSISGGERVYHKPLAGITPLQPMHSHHTDPCLPVSCSFNLPLLLFPCPLFKPPPMYGPMGGWCGRPLPSPSHSLTSLSPLSTERALLRH